MAIFSLLMAGGVAYALLLGAVYLFQPGMLYLPDMPGRALQATPREIGLAYEDVHIDTDDGETLHGWLVPAREPAATVLFFHGNAGNISHRLDTLAIFHQLGLDVLMIDYRGYGESTGRPSEQGTYRDARAAWDYLVRERAVPEQRIVLFGRSLGGAVATWLATQVRPHALVVESTFTSVPERAAELFPWLPARLLSRFRYDSLQRIAEVQTPVLVIHSPDDEVVPFHHGQALYRAAASPKAFARIRGDHNGGFLLSRERYMAQWRRFLGLAGAPTSREPREREEPTPWARITGSV